MGLAKYKKWGRLLIVICLPLLILFSNAIDILYLSELEIIHIIIEVIIAGLLIYYFYRKDVSSLLGTRDANKVEGKLREKSKSFKVLTYDFTKWINIVLVAISFFIVSYKTVKLLINVSRLNQWCPNELMLIKYYGVAFIPVVIIAIGIFLSLRYKKKAQSVLLFLNILTILFIMVVCFPLFGPRLTRDVDQCNFEFEIQQRLNQIRK